VTQLLFVLSQFCCFRGGRHDFAAFAGQIETLSVAAMRVSNPESLLISDERSAEQHSQHIGSRSTYIC
jgi:hypothetical protein